MRVRERVRERGCVFPSADSRKAVASYLRKYAHEVLVNRLGGLGLQGKVWLG